MSTRVMGMVFDGGPEDLGQHSVLLALADNADDAGVAWPGDELLARKSRLSVRQLIRVRAALEAEGWFTVARRRRVVRDGEQRYGNLYQLNLAKLRAAAETARKTREEECEKRARAPKKRRDIVSRASVNYAAKIEACGNPHDTMSPRTSTEQNDMTSEQIDVTSASKRHDMPPSEVLSNEEDIFRNRHLTIIEPNTTPIVPASGDAGVRVSPAARKAAALLWQAHRVLRELNISDQRKQDRLVVAIGDALEMHCDRAKCTPEVAGDLAVTMVRRFISERSLMRHGWGWTRFFAEGFWAKPELWPYDRNALREISRGREASIGIYRQDPLGG
ncbi:hypothetical protein GCM10011507_35090 [Edaphobacter acidisoli]|uniref:Helix-turn-helix domain-containing protein n=1 Tax=Edaphobacter acidisoli TaxID=2040573 RepID=A0A916WAA9_9BACT|nr:hypothetical protein [Edaphobacter acidisoli]GGA80847.1 hypothetical protein GCM10011507_35090 [Edaphobacter acidisoli]